MKLTEVEKSVLLSNCKYFGKDWRHSNGEG